MVVVALASVDVVVGAAPEAVSVTQAVVHWVTVAVASALQLEMSIMVVVGAAEELGAGAMVVVLWGVVLAVKLWSVGGVVNVGEDEVVRLTWGR
jgi:hypothetical protein